MLVIQAKKQLVTQKILDIESKYFTSVNYNKITSQTIDAKIKQKKLIDKSAIAIFINNVDLDKKVATLVTKTELKTEQDKIAKLQTYDINYLLCKFFLVMAFFYILWFR